MGLLKEYSVNLQHRAKRWVPSITFLFNQQRSATESSGLW